MKTYVAHMVEDRPGNFRVWAENKEDGEHPYVGPVAAIYGDKDWVWVETDPFEGSAMINREALPKLIKALKALEKHLSTTESQKP